MQREPNLTNAALMARRRAALPAGLGQAHEVFVDRAENAEVWDVEGRRLIDFAGGIAVLNTGHRHPALVEAVKAQLDRVTHTCFQVLAYEPYVELAERLNTMAPGAFAKKSFFMTTGAEAVENAVKVARAYTKRSAVIAFGGGFHGRTMMGMALTGKVVPYKVGFGPFPAEVYHAKFPCALHGVSTADSLASIEALFKYDVEPSRVAAIILEPVQGEGGFYEAPIDFVKALRELCDRHGILLIADEVQTGFARTGALFACEHEVVVPDLIVTAKGIAGGLPLAAVTGRAEMIDAPHAGGLGGTYGGNPIACAAALATLETIRAEHLVERAQEIGRLMLDRLHRMQADDSRIGDVRGRGAMIAVELVRKDTTDPDPDLTKAVATAAHQAGLIVLTCGTYGNVLRFLPPLAISDELLTEGLDLLAAILATGTGDHA